MSLRGGARGGTLVSAWELTIRVERKISVASRSPLFCIGSKHLEWFACCRGATTPITILERMNGVYRGRRVFISAPEEVCKKWRRR